MGQPRDRLAQAVVFDLDGTLYPTRQAAVRSWRLVLRHARLFRAFRRVRIQVRAIRPISDLHALQADLVADRMGIDPAEARALIDAVVYARLPDALRGVRTHPGVQRALTELRERGAKLGVLSDMPPDAKLRDLGLRGFACAVTSEATDYLKPNPEPFRYVAELLDVRPEQVLYVGNHYRYDILGASAVGMLTAHHARRAEQSSRAELTFLRYDSLMPAIRAAGIRLPSGRVS